MPFPEGWVWDFPGFYSLMNIYGRQSDFFWSGHVGIMLLFTIELYHLRFRKLIIFQIMNTFFVGITVIVFRIHYTSDVVAGLIIAHWCYYVSGFWIGYLDPYLIKDFNLEPKRSTVRNENAHKYSYRTQSSEEFHEEL